MPEELIQISDLKNYLGNRWVHDGVDLVIRRGDVVAIIGGSGCGKTTLLRSILMLHPITSGSIRVFGIDISHSSVAEARKIRQRWGVMFQSGALFSSLNVMENIIFPMNEFVHIDKKTQQEISLIKIQLVGLDVNDALKLPAELSGGMRKRAAMARAIALDPELVFLDEPTAGLDPKSAGELDNLVLDLRDGLGLTFVMVTHDLDTLEKVPNRVVFLGEGKVLADGPLRQVMETKHPMIQDYFSGDRSPLQRERREVAE